MIEVRRGADRYAGGDAGSGIATLHAFSFAGFYDPENVRFGVLMACNEERLAAGAGFAAHAHRDTEIVTWVIEGELEHRTVGAAGVAESAGPGGGSDSREGSGGDSGSGGDPGSPPGSGGPVLLRAGDVQRLSAAGGVRHVERNAGAGPLRFLQMWLHPDVYGGEPEYGRATAPVPEGPGLRPLASGRGGAPLRLRQEGAVLYAGRPVAADRVPLPDAPFLYVHVVRGDLRIGGERLGAGDAARISEARGLTVETAGPAEYLVWEMHAEPSYG